MAGGKTHHKPAVMGTELPSKGRRVDLIAKNQIRIEIRTASTGTETLGGQ